MIRPSIAVAAAWLVGLTALWLLARAADESRTRPHRAVPIAQVIDVGPKIVRTIKIDPCDVARTFVEKWKCRSQ